MPTTYHSQNIPPWLERCVILQGTVGSTAHGLALEGTDDSDLMGVCIEPIEEALTLGQAFEQAIHRTAAIRTGQMHAPSQHGDVDRTVFGLRKFCQLAAAGNPTTLLLFYVPAPEIRNALGGVLRDMAPLFVSKEAGKRFLGYMQGQMQRLQGTRGQKRVNRSELEAAHGFDTKYAMHVLRLGHQGVELLETGKLSLPMGEPLKSRLMSLRRGEWRLEDVFNEAAMLEQRLKKLLDTSLLPEHPDRVAINAWMQQTYLEMWKARQPLFRAVGDKFIQVER